MNRRGFLKSMGLGAAAMGLELTAGARPKGARPNILFIMSDDHSHTAIGAYNSRLAKLNPTPVIDTLARDGMTLDRCFCTNSICTPSRATILTGQYSQANGVLDLNGKLPPEKQYLPRLMGEAGYLTAMIGKWHLKEEPASFDYYKVLPGQGLYFDPVFRVRGKEAFPKNEVTMKGHSSDMIGDSAIEWLKTRDKTKPFFFCLHFKAPHGHWENAPRYDSYLEDVEIPYPKSLFESGNHGSIATRGYEDELIRYIGASIGRRNVMRNQINNTKTILPDEGVSDEDMKKNSYQNYLKKFLRCVKGVDDNVKRVLEVMKKDGCLDNTVIMYTGDQGMWLGEHDYIDKRWMYEESLRMPFIVRYPESVKAGSRSDALVNNTDFAPTILDLAGVKTPDYMHGASFKSLLETGREPEGWRKATYYRYWMHMAHHYNPAHFGIRTKRHKLIFFYGLSTSGKGIQTPPGWELYDLEKDPKEMNNLYGDPKYAKITKRLKKQLIALREEFDETDKDYPQIQAVIDKFWNDSPENGAEAIRISHAAKAAYDGK